MYSIGIDIGYSSIKIALLNKAEEVVFSKYLRHKGAIKSNLLKVLEEVGNDYKLENIVYGIFTGSASKFLNKSGNITRINEIGAITGGSLKLYPEIKSIIEIGGENAKFISNLSLENQSKIEVSMNSSCSSGTGSFLEEQMSRLGLELEDYSRYVKKARSIPRIAGRCSVFAKTDITHHQQEGASVEDILLGLAYAVVRNYKGGVVKNAKSEKPALFIGGVSSNSGIITALKDIMNFSDNELIVSKYSNIVAAIGSAMIGIKDKRKANILDLIQYLKNTKEVYTQEDGKLERLSIIPTLDISNKHLCRPLNNFKKCYLGVDIGSTSTNLVLMDNKNEIITYKYLRTLGNPANAVKKGLKEIKREFGNKIEVVGVATTGSGRYMVGDIIGADVIKDEITAQAKAAVALDPEVDTIFEIGGQDSKFISIKNGKVVDFQMNKICAAGTGSFIEEQSKKFNIPIEVFSNNALKSNSPINLGERCTVFIESSIASCLAKGAKLNDITSGLCYSIVKNYLNRVVGQKKVGNKIFFQGGVAFNEGIVNAFRIMTNKQIIIPPFFSVTGAYGAAILAKEEVEEKTKFKGFDIDFEKEETRSKKKKAPKSATHGFDEDVRNMVFKSYSGEIAKEKKTIGIPRALFTYGMFSMFNQVFKSLGFNVILSEPTSERTIELGQQYSLDETCFPVKLITGHVAELVENKVDYIFFPDLHSVEHPDSPSRKNYGCAYMQLAFKIMNQAVGLDKKGIELLSPTFAFSMGKEFMMQSFSKMGQQLNKTNEETMKAMQAGMLAFNNFEKQIGEYSRHITENIKPDEKVFVLISKIYGVGDPVLNLGVPAKLSQMGYKVLPFYALPEGDISHEYPNMFWPFGQHILEPIQLIKQHPNLYVLYLSHHGCGPDSVLSHYVKEIMDEKPYLQIEVDEHSSDVGVITRIEAFINSLGKTVTTDKTIDYYHSKIVHKNQNLKKNLNTNSTIYLPALYPYSNIFQEILRAQGYKTKVISPTNKESVDRGRKFSITEEYFSLTAFLGDVFTEIENSEESNVSVLIPQNEGTETDGQYSRVLQTKLEEAGLKNVNIISPFTEDIFKLDATTMNLVFLAFISGDIILAAPKESRDLYLGKIQQLITNKELSLEKLLRISEQIFNELKRSTFTKSILAIGEVFVIYNNYLNNNTFSTLEDNGYRILYTPLSETLWMFWQDYIDQNKLEYSEYASKQLQQFKEQIKTIARCLADMGPFEIELSKLPKLADRTVGYYSGAFGRFRQAKLLSHYTNTDGIITASSMYENTGIVMNILSKGFNITKPVLNLTFDGNKNENDDLKIESFIYYL